MEEYRILDYTTWTPLEQVIDELKQGLMFLKDNRKRVDIEKEDIGAPSGSWIFETSKRILLEWTMRTQSSDRWLHWLPQPIDIIQMFPHGRDVGNDAVRQPSHDIPDDEVRRWLSLLIMAVHESGWLLEQHPTALVVAPSQFSSEREYHFQETSRLFGKIYQCNENGRLIRNQSLYMISEKPRPYLLREPDSEWIELFRDRWKKTTLSSNLEDLSQLEAIIEHRYRLINWYDPNWKKSLIWTSFGLADSFQKQFSIQEESSLPSFFIISWGPRQDPLEYLEWTRQKSWIVSEDFDNGQSMDSLELVVPDTWGPSHRWKVVFRPISYIRTPLKEGLYHFWQTSLTAAVPIEEEEPMATYRDTEDKPDDGTILDSIRYILQKECYARSLEIPSQKSTNQGESSHIRMSQTRGKVARLMTITYLLTRYLLNQCQLKSHRSQWFYNVRLWWQRLLRELRWHWEHRVTLCNLETPAIPDYQTPLVHQKFQLLQYCILQSKRQTSFQETRCDDRKEVLDRLTSNQQVEEEEIFFETVEEMSTEKHWGKERRGIQQRLSNILSQSTGEPLYIPVTLDPGFKTEDQIEEEHLILSNLGNSSEAAIIRARMQSGPLLSGKTVAFSLHYGEKTRFVMQYWSWNTHVAPDILYMESRYVGV